MRLEQAIFTSADDRGQKGYQLVSRSAGIDSSTAQELAHWSPSHAALAGADSRAASINCFPVSREQYAISRTIYGGPEYSSRGGYQILTRVLVASGSLLENYEQNAIALVRTALALGFLRMLIDPPQRIADIDLPLRPLFAAIDDPNTAGLDHDSRRALDALQAHTAAIERGEKVCVVGDCDPVATYERYLLSVPIESRGRLSVATGIWPSASRPYQIHFLPVITALRQSRLKAQGIDHVIRL